MKSILQKIESKEVTVGVVGLGYVGYPLALLFAEAGSNVIGFDSDPVKVEKINSGESYIRHINHGRLQHARKELSFFATEDMKEIGRCDAVILAVPTPLDPTRAPDLRFIIDSCKAISPHLKEGALFSLESTSWPGTTEEVVRPILQESGKSFFLVFSPEREDPGNPLYTTKTIPKLVGGVDPESLEVGCALYKIAIDEVIPVSEARVAESAKLLENVFRSVNIALVNELKTIFDKMGIDVWEVIEAAKTKPFGFMPFYPGPGLGGHCIPIDPFYLAYKAKEFGADARFIELSGEINRAMPHYVVRKVQDCLNDKGKALKGSKILLLGLAYKPDIDDMRESPSLELFKLLEEKGAEVSYYDPHLPVIGKTREYAFLEGRESKEPSKKYDLFLLATNHSVFNKNALLSHGVPIVDTRRVFEPTNPLVYPA